MHFRDLNEAQILALAITAEEEEPSTTGPPSNGGHPELASPPETKQAKSALKTTLQTLQ